MNFISMSRSEEPVLELKYCERCGGLWIRRQGQSVVYCGLCRAQVAALLSSRSPRKRGARLPQNPRRIERLLGIAAQGVRP